MNRSARTLHDRITLVNRQVLVFVVIAVGLIAGVFTYFTRDIPPAPAPAARPAPPRDTPAPAVDSPEVPPPAAVPAPPAARRPARPVPVVTAPPEPAAPATATLHITSDVPGAQVFLDRKFIGAAPVTAEDVAPGSRQINVSGRPLAPLLSMELFVRLWAQR